MTLLFAAAALIIIVFVLQWWLGVNLQEGILGKGFLLIIIVLVIAGILQLFGLLPFRLGWGSIGGAAFASLPAGAAACLRPVLR